VLGAIAVGTSSVRCTTAVTAPIARIHGGLKVCRYDEI